MKMLMRCALMAVIAAPALAQTAPLYHVGLVVRSSAGWDDNVLFSSPESGGDASGNLSAGVEAGVATSRTTFRLFGDAGIRRFREQHGMDGSLYNVGADLTRRATERLSLHATGDVRTMLSHGVAPGPEADALPLSYIRMRTVSSDASYVLSPRGTMALEVGDSKVDFDDPHLFDGTQQYARSRLDYDLSERMGSAFSYEWSRNVLSEETQIHTVDGALLSRDSTHPMHVRAGVSLTKWAGTIRALPVGDASVGREWKRTSVALDYARVLTQGYDIGGMLTSHDVTGRLGYLLTRRDRVSLSAGHSWVSALASDANYRLRTAEIGLQHTLTDAVDLSAAAYAHRRTDTRAIDTRGFRVSIEARTGAHMLAR